MSAKFPLGRLVITPGALEKLDSESLQRALRRHLNGDWGDLDQHDKNANDRALVEHARVLSAHCDSGGAKFWIITEADRSATTILLPSEY